MSEPNRKEDYFFKATLVSKGTNAWDVPCKVFLPERIFEKPTVLFKPDTSSDATKLTSRKDIELKAEIVGMNQEIQTTIQAEVYCSRSGAPYWGSGLSEPFANGQLEHLMIIDHLCFPEHKDKTDIVFWVTPNELLTPSMHCSTFYTGEITRERDNNVEFLIKDGVRLAFDQHFKTKEIDSGELMQWSYLVACAELPHLQLILRCYEAQFCQTLMTSCLLHH